MYFVWNNFRKKFPNAQVPTLEEAIQLSLKLGLKIYFDVKGNADQVRVMAEQGLPLQLLIRVIMSINILAIELTNVALKEMTVDSHILVFILAIQNGAQKI